MKKGIRKTIAALLSATIVMAGILPVMSRKAEADEEKYAIIVSTEASDPERFAAEALFEYLSDLPVNDLHFIEDDPLIADDQIFEGYRFCVGTTSVYPTSDIADAPADSYVIAPFTDELGDGVAIYGSGSRGTVYGVFTFLEDFCGYRHYTYLSGMVSTTGNMELPSERIEYEPYFEYRNTDWRSGWYPLYSVANKLNGCYQASAPEMGGNIPYLGGSSHTFTNVFCSSDVYFESHPEYFALHDSKRVPGQLCLTNDEVYEIVLDEVLDLLRNEYDPDADLQIISLTQADNLDYCECPECAAVDNANGSHAGTMVTFVNRIAGAVKAEGYDNVAFDTFAYTYTRKAPSDVEPLDNVIIRLCTFECCFSHALDDENCPQNKELMDDLKEWSEICDRLYIWDYTTNYAYTLGIFPDFGVLQENMQCFYENGIKGVYEEGNYYIPKCDTEFGDLRTYLIAKLMEDPYCEYDSVMLDFCNYFYGEGGRFIKEAIDMITANVKGHVTIYSSMTETFSIDEEEAAQIDQLWEMAENAATGSDAIAAIKRSKLSWRYVKAALGLREFNGTPEEIRDEMEALHSDLIAHDVVMIDEWVGIEDDFSEYELVPIEEWEYAGYYDYLRYDSNGGKDGPSNEWFKDETEISDIIPTLDGTQFLGWAKSAEATEPEYQPGDRFAANTNTTLFAVWETNNPVYRVVSGADETYILDSGKDYVFTVKRNVNDGHCFEHFTGVDLDGKTLTIGMDYTAVKGSTVVTIKSAVLNRLSVGPHTITVSFDDGEVEISLTVKEVSTPAPEPFGPYLVPDTGTK